MEKLSLLILEIGNSPYRVYDLQHGYDNGFRKNNAYWIKTDLEEAVYPYRGEVKSFKELFEQDSELKPGIYSLKNHVPVKIQLKRAIGKEAELYSPKNITDLTKADLTKAIKDDSIIHVKLNTSGGSAWMPELSEEDDATSTLLKSAIRLKGMVFADYANRLEVSAVGKGQGSKGVSAKSNSKRAIENNHTTSMNKLLYYCDAFELDVVIGLRDKPGARDPMLPNGEVLTLFPLSAPFPLDNVVTVQDMKEEIDTAHLSYVEEGDEFGEL
jgi:hypothetical protein|nr:MAG TPA: hypothetical protein [Caudoviricetes sp.]